MADANITLHNRDLRRIEITVTVPKLMRFRIWLGTQLMKIGARVFGCSIDFKIEGERECP